MDYCGGIPLKKSEHNLYRKKPVVIGAIQWNGNKAVDHETPDWFVRAVRDRTVTFSSGIGETVAMIKTLEGLMVANLGDWILRGVKGEVYPCKNDIFAATYEPVEETCPVNQIV